MGYPFSCSFSRTNAFYGIFAPGAIGEMGLHPTKLEEMARVSLRNTLRGNSTKDYSKTQRSRRNEQSIPPPMKNERHMPNEIY